MRVINEKLCFCQYVELLNELELSDQRKAIDRKLCFFISFKPSNEVIANYNAESLS